MIPSNLCDNIDAQSAVKKMLNVCEKHDEFDTDPWIHSIRTILNTDKIDAAKKTSLIGEVASDMIEKFGDHEFIVELLEASLYME